MIIERTEMIILSENERAALQLVQRMMEGIRCGAECPELKRAAGDAIHALNCFDFFTRTAEGV